MISFTTCFAVLVTKNILITNIWWIMQKQTWLTICRRGPTGLPLRTYSAMFTPSALVSLDRGDNTDVGSPLPGKLPGRRRCEMAERGWGSWDREDGGGWPEKHHTLHRSTHNEMTQLCFYQVMRFAGEEANHPDAATPNTCFSEQERRHYLPCCRPTSSSQPPATTRPSPQVKTVAIYCHCHCNMKFWNLRHRVRRIPLFANHAPVRACYEPEIIKTSFL